MKIDQYPKASDHLKLLANWFVLETMFKISPQVKFTYVETVLKRPAGKFTELLNEQLAELIEHDKTSLIQALIELGFSTIAVAKLIGCSQPTVSYHKNRELQPKKFESYINKPIQYFEEQRILKHDE